MRQEKWPAVLAYLTARPTGTFTYGEIAEAIGSHPRAIGAIMRALGNRGYTGPCGQVKKKDDNN